MKTLVAGIVAATLCVGMASQTLAHGTNNIVRAGHPGEGRFAKMDANNDSQLSWDEMLAFHTAKWQAVFQQRTAKGETKITWDQFLAKRTAKLKTRFQAMDANGDGSVSKDEWRTYCKAHKSQHEGSKPASKSETAPATGMS